MDPTTAADPPSTAPGGDTAPNGSPGLACIVVTGGDPVDPGVLDHLPGAALVIGVDSGIGHALGLGLQVDLAVGDFDSVDPATLATAEAAGARVQRHPRAKDATDLELGLTAALAAGATRIVVVGGHGGRLDHLLANTLLLAAAAFEGVAVEAHMGTAWLVVARPGAVTTVAGDVGEVVSLLPVGGAATGVVTTGLAYPLDGEALAAGSTRGASNELVSPNATVTLDGGSILVIKPGDPVATATSSTPHPGKATS